MLVGQRHGHPVHLGLAREVERAQVELGVGPPEPFAPCPQFLLVEGIVETHHRHPVPHLREEPRRSGTDRLRGRVRRGESRVALLELPQLEDEAVVLGVGDLGRVEDVVQLVVVDDEPPQLEDPRRVGRGNVGRHRQAAMPAPTTASGWSAS